MWLAAGRAQTMLESARWRISRWSAKKWLKNAMGSMCASREGHVNTSGATAGRSASHPQNIRTNGARIEESARWKLSWKDTPYSQYEDESEGRVRGMERCVVVIMKLPQYKRHGRGRDASVWAATTVSRSVGRLVK
jgi:hypothetical protein